MTQFLHSREIIHLLYWLTGLLAALDAFILFRRRLHREVPWFTIYLLTVVANEVVGEYLYSYSDNINIYFVGWIFVGAVVVLGSMFTIESISTELLDFPTVRKWGRNTLIVAGAVVLMIAIAAVPYGSENTSDYMKATQVAMRSIRMIQLAVIVTFFAFTSYFALSWRHYQIGILLGYGAYVAVSMSSSAITAQIGRSIGRLMIVVDASAYLCILILWLVYIVRHEPRIRPRLTSSSPRELEEWTDALSELTSR